MTALIAVVLIVVFGMYILGYRKGRSDSIVIVVPPPQLPEQTGTSSFASMFVTIFALIIILGILIS